MANTRNMNRRNFIQTAAAGVALTHIAGQIATSKGATSPHKKVNIAGIGIGGMGFANLQNLESQNIVALCDVDHTYAAKAFNRYPQARQYQDYRQMLEKQKDIEAVLIATPDHTHAQITIDCMKAGKHVYCQKPLTHTVKEARAVARVARETGVVTQMGIQGHSAEGIHLICEWIWDGAIGKIEQVDAWCSLAYYPPGQAYWCTTHYDIPTEKPPVPAGLDWNLWLGPAPWRDYHPTYHPGRWRAWYDFGCGMMGDRGVHTLDSVFMALKLQQPEVISATVSNLNNQTHPITSIVNYHFAARENMPPVKLTWYEGIEVPRPEELEDGRRLPAEGGIIFKGEKGAIMCGVYGDNPQIIPLQKMRDYQRPPKTLPRIEGSHEMEWINAIKEGRRANADFAYSAQLTEFVLLGNLAKRTQSKLYYDAQQCKITNNDQANALLETEYRTGW